MTGYLCLVLHAHLPFVRHPEHESFLEESWLFEAITECYIPLLQLLEAWRRDGLPARLTLTLTPTLCSMLQDPLLQARYQRRLEGLIELARNELQRTRGAGGFHELAAFYQQRLTAIREFYRGCRGDLAGAFKESQDRGQIEIITSAATHALLPLLAPHPPSVRAQILTARDHYRSCFGQEPRGIWLPECGYTESLETALQEARLRWFLVDAPGLLQAQPAPRYGVFAPVLTPNVLAVFGRDLASARQVWSRQEGYPGDPRYRDFYRDIGFDLDLEYLKPWLPAPGRRGFTGMKYFRITGNTPNKAIYERAAALEAAQTHADHFCNARLAQIQRLAPHIDQPPLIVSAYDAELFGHWWFEGPEFLDALVRQVCARGESLALITPEEYLRRHRTHQVAAPAASSWGEGGYWRVWLNEKNQWIYPRLRTAQQRMTELAQIFEGTVETPMLQRALKQAARELLLAQASDWPFILQTGTSPGYARRRVLRHLLRFGRLYEQLKRGDLDEKWLARIEAADNLFPEVDWRHWLPT